MCRTEEEIRENDVVCQEIQKDYIDERKKETNGDKTMDLIFARALLKSRIISIQTKENLDSGFTQIADTYKKIDRRLDSIETAQELIRNKTLYQLWKTKPKKIITWVCSLFISGFLLLYLIVEVAGIQALVDRLKDVCF